MNDKNSPPYSPGFKTRWFQGFVAIFTWEFRHMIVGVLGGGVILALLVAIDFISLRSAIIGTLLPLTLCLVIFARAALRVARNPFAVCEYNEWLTEQVARGVDPMRQDWYYWFKETHPQYKYRTPPRKIAAYSK